MGLVDAADLLALALRLLFVLLLYALVVAVLVALRRELRLAGGAAGVAAAAPPRAARLTLLDAAAADGPAGRVVPLAGETTIGRRSHCEVTLSDDAVSGRHARLAPRDGSWQIEDLGSTNGTYVNGRRVAGPQPLRSGDVVTAGNAAWRFDLVEP
jgi:hypothetical protein